MTRIVSALLLKVVLLSLLFINALPLKAGILNAQEQGIANYLVNSSGQKRNRAVMQVDATLTAVARAKAKDMATRRYFDHTTPSGTGPNYAIRSAGYPLPLWWGTARNDNTVESIGAGYTSPSEAWNALMTSAAHRTHLLATDSFYADQTAYGVGYYYDPESPYWHYYVIITAPPRAGSTLTISTPASGARVETGTIAVTGTSGGSGVLSSLDIRLENSAGASAWAHVNLPGGSGIGTWTTNVSGILPGSNTIHLRSYAGGGNLMAETTRTVRWVMLRPLTVTVYGDGRISSGFLGTSTREVGATYTITGVPLDGSTMFSHWTGLPPGANANASRQTFRMAEGLSFTANFVPNPFWERRGSFVGVLSGAEPSNAGAIRIQVGATGGFTGRLFYGKVAYSIAGTFDINGQAIVTIPRSTSGAISLGLTLDLSGATDQLTGIVSENGAITTVTADRRDIAGESHEPGRFTVRISPDAAVPGAPVGNGYMMISTNETGAARIAGTLADGRAFTANSIISKTGIIPIYVRLFSGAGAIAGSVTLADTATSDIAGTVRWFKPERPLDKYYPDAFTAQNELTGSRYVRPIKGTPFIDFQTAANRGLLLLTQGNIDTQISQSLEVAPDNRIALQLPSYTGLKVIVNPNNGRFSGKFVHPSAGVRPFSGVVSQKEHSGWGFFLGLDQAGSTSLQPEQ